MANHSHKRETNARQFSRAPRATTIAGSLAVLATASAVSLGVITSDAGVAPTFMAGAVKSEVAAGPTAGDSTPAALDLAGDLDRRVLSRGGARGGTDATDATDASTHLSKVEKLLRPKKVRKAIGKADTKQFTTEALNLWTEPGAKARKTGEIAAGEKVLLTGRSLKGRDELVLGKKTRWVTSGYFSDEKPAEEPTIGGSCTNGSSVPSGVSPNIVKVHAAVCAAFPDLTNYGTFRGDGEHAQGIAIDIMVSGAEGYAVAEFVRANAAALGVSYVIYSQRIWSVQRGSEGWRGMASRGSVTANHYDHVHVTTY
ncbi:hypothetical protein BH09ACT12_BH09ACT12_10800 [soil metagenome]